MKQIQFNKAVEEVEIDGTKYEIDLSDESKKKHMQYKNDLLNIEKKYKDIDAEDDESILKAMEDIKQSLQVIFDGMLGKGAFDEIYPKTNKSIEVTMEVLFDVIAYLDEVRQEKVEAKKQKYLQHKR